MKKTARVFSNDPARPQMTVGLQGLVWAPVHIKPRFVRLKGTEDQDLKGVVRLEGQKEEPLRAELDAQSIPDEVAASLKEIEKGRAYQLTVTNRMKKEGRFKGKLTITTNYPDKPRIFIPIVCHIRGPIEVRPKILSFGRMDQNRLETLKKSSGRLVRSVSIVLNKGNNLEIAEATLENAIFTASIRENRPGRSVQILVEPVVEKLKKGINEDVLKIRTNQKGHEILEVPVKLDLL